MKSILFVDDEPNVLSALRRMLRSMRGEWDMLFVNGGKAALDALEERDFDIVVSDLRMPQMDGVALLQEVRKRSPRTVRISLSGYSDKEMALRAVSEIHQFLSKPCEAEQLITTLERAIALSNLLSDERLKGLVSQMRTVPSLPALHDEVMRQLDAPDSSLRVIGKAMSQDGGMSSKVLQLVNSSFFGLSQVVSDPVQAAVLLGIDSIRTLVFSVKIFDQFQGEHLADFSLDRVWEHSVEVARLAKRIAVAETTDEHAAECAFLAGLLHDIGKLVFAANAPDRYRSILKLGESDPAVTDRLERKMIGAAHQEVGAYLIGLWGFSEGVIASIAHHHSPQGCRVDTQNPFPPCAAVYAANMLVHQKAAVEVGESPYQFDESYLNEMGCGERVALWRKMSEQCSEKPENE